MNASLENASEINNNNLTTRERERERVARYHFDEGSRFRGYESRIRR